jgi:hypothetical protein
MNQPNLRKPMDLIKASELVLQELSNMTDEELVLALEACEDNSIGYAVYGEEINLDITNESCKITHINNIMRRK